MSRKHTVHVVMACTTYEDNAMVRAFADASAAAAFKAKLDAHESKRPIPPETYSDTPEGNADYDAWDAKEKSWRKRHPAGQAFTTYQEFAVAELPYTP
jgi:hypothetical protein